jgi:hypothetical protein
MSIARGATLEGVTPVVGAPVASRGSSVDWVGGWVGGQWVEGQNA